MQSYHLSVLISTALVFTSSSYARAGSEQILSQNYLKVFSLHREGDTARDASPELERVVSEHNQKLTENPAKKNRNRIVYVNGPKQYKAVRFPILRSATLIDGSGKMIGHLAPNVKTVEINFGQHKMIGGKDHVMVFAARMAEAVTGTGWIATSDLLPSPELTQFSDELAMKVANTPAMGDAPERYKVECGGVEGWDDGRLKILPKVDDRRNRHEAASDYVVRPGGVCYLLTSLPGHGGVATDILSRDTIFVPAAGMPRVEVPLYLPTDSTSSERDAWSSGKMPHQMEFRYGRVGDRYGWIALTNLQSVSDDSKGH